MLKANALAVMLVSFTLCLSGCTPYWRDRRNDLADIGKLSAGYCLGLQVDAQVTDFVHPCLGVGEGGVSAGHESREISGVWPQVNYCYPYTTLNAEALAKKLHRPEHRGATTLHACYDLDEGDGKRLRTCEVSRYMVWKDYYVVEDENRNELGKPVHVSWARRMGIEVSLDLAVVTLRAGLNPAELVDLLVGFTTLDIAGDDGQEQNRRGHASGVIAK